MAPLPATQCLVHRDYAIVDQIAAQFSDSNTLDALLGRFPVSIQGPPLLNIQSNDPAISDYANDANEVGVLNLRTRIEYRMFQVLLNIQTRDHETALKINELLQAQSNRRREALGTVSELQEKQELKKKLDATELKKLGDAQADAKAAAIERARLSDLYLPDPNGTGSLDPNSVMGKISQRKDMLLAIGRQLVAALASALWNALVATNQVPGNDHVIVARLFYTWIAHSFGWQWRNPTELEARVGGAPNSQPASTIARGFQVCLGMSQLFVDMFNTVMTTNNFQQYGPQIRAQTVIGNARTRRRVPVRNVTQRNDELAHAWNAFPLTSDANGNVTSWKVIDVCWARNQNQQTRAFISFDPTFFTRSNATMLQDHCPEPRAYPGPGAFEQKQFVPADQQITEDAFWERDLPDCVPVTVSRWQVDLGSARPQEALIRATSVITLKRSCDHIPTLANFPQPSFWLRLSGKNKMGVTFTTVGTPLVFNGATSTYTAQVTIPFPAMVGKGQGLAQVVVPLDKTTGAPFTGPPPADDSNLNFDAILEWQVPSWQG